MRKVALFLAAVCASSSLLFAGKPWRPAVEKLVPDSALIVVGTVKSLTPIRMTDKDGNHYEVAEINVSETLKGKTPKELAVVVQAAPKPDEKGSAPRVSSAFRYELKQGDHAYLLYLQKSSADATDYVPVHSGSGIVDLSSDRVGDGPQELEALRKYLREKGR